MPRAGVPLTPEHRARISASLKGRKYPDKGEAMRGKRRKAIPSYVQAHARLGVIAGLQCSCGCGKPATTWALKPDVPAERVLTGANGYAGLRYSACPDDYQPMTRSCHWKMDGHGSHLKNHGKAQSDKTHCPQGHPYSGWNLVLVKLKNRANPGRTCRKCANKRALARYHKRRLAKLSSRADVMTSS